MTELLGKTLGQYQIVEFTRDTGAILVYKGFQPNMNRFVLVKVLKSHEPHAVQSFMQQNELLAQIQHANILPVYDSGQAEDVSYRVMRFAEGGVLQDQMMQYYNLSAVTRLMSGIVAGLEKIHAKGFIHGNLQPGNIYLDEAGQPLLTDFGTPRTSASPVTPFMSPEQVQGGMVDKRTDVYALGVLLYVLATGATPPAGGVVSLRAKRPDLSESVEKIVFKAMAQNPDARFQSVHEFQNALFAALQPVVPAVPAQAVSQPQAYQPVPYRRGPNWAAIILGIFLVAVIIGGMGFVFGWWGNRASEPVAGVPIEPPVEAPPPTQLPEIPEVPIEQPTEAPITPPDNGKPIQLPEVCNSIIGTGGIVFVGGALSARKRFSSKRRGRKL